MRARRFKGVVPDFHLELPSLIVARLRAIQARAIDRVASSICANARRAVRGQARGRDGVARLSRRVRQAAASIALSASIVIIGVIAAAVMLLLSLFMMSPLFFLSLSLRLWLLLVLWLIDSIIVWPRRAAAHSGVVA